ncbi:cysteine protease ATG4D [Ctenocephalides felis]|uniref:cysteine protease ATG4D n=1 Tax=Ctenocephalides felis TaxID=7515 RepID=UPI000E6E5192|nr:cysteine protease ATG4D [Ctenocephalides felis]
MSYEVLSWDKIGFGNFGNSSNNRLEDAQSKNKVETKLMSMWNNMKYGWTVKIRTNFSKELPVWLLGRCYHKKSPSPESSVEVLGSSISSMELATDATGMDNVWEGDSGIEGFKLDFTSRLWLTYRREFATLRSNNTGPSFSSDCGWGCMLRSGQMMLAQALICHFLGRGWRWHGERSGMHMTAAAFQEDRLHRMIVKWFGDKSSKNSPLSIHALVALGEQAGRRAGDWYGPGAVAHLLKQAVQQAAQENTELDNLAVYVAQDCAVYLQDVLDCCQPTAKINATPPWKQKSSSSQSNTERVSTNSAWKALVLLVPLRLGAEKLNQIYGPCLLAMLSQESCIGIIGGRPRHSLYFIGYQDDKLIHLDPHYCQDAVDVWVPDFPLQSFHCKSPRKMNLSKIDPSCCIGFYLPTRHEFESFVQNIQEYLVPPSCVPGSSEYPMFVFCEGKSTQAQGTPLNISRYCPSSQLLQSDSDFETEEFELL